MYVKRAETAHMASSSQPIPASQVLSTTASMGNPQPSNAFASAASESLQAQSGDHFHDMAARHALSAQENETDRDPVAPASIIGHSVKLVELFNFMDTHWVQVYERAA